MRLEASAIGGAKVVRAFTMGGDTLKPGHVLTREEVLAMPPANRNALAESGRISVFPPMPAILTQRHVVSVGFGRYNVIEGRMVNDLPLTKEEALALAGVTPDEDEDTEAAAPPAD